LRLEAGGADTSLTVPSNGEFQFAEPLARGAAYRVAIASHPANHTCVVATGERGTIGDADVTNLSIACTGPAGTIALSGPWGWTFDPTEEIQRFTGSIAAQEVALTISGTNLIRAQVRDMAVTLGEETPPIALPLGTTTVPVTLTASVGQSKTYQLVFDRGGALLDQTVYGKASNTGTRAGFGFAIALSGDTLVVGADTEASSATGVNGNQTDRNADAAGAAYVFIRTGTTWTQQAYLKASNTEQNDFFGHSVALSGDTLAVGATGEDSNAPGVNGSDIDNSLTSAGAVYVFVRTGTTWAQQAYVKASNPGANDFFGGSVALSGDTLAVGALGESSDATGIDGNQASDAAINAGAVYAFVRTGTTWAQQAYLKASNTGAFDEFGNSVVLSGDTLAIGAPGESSSATGINPAAGQADNSAPAAGAAYVFVRAGTTWTQEAYLKASNTGAFDRFGFSVALSGDTLAVGAIGEASSATGINPAAGQADNSVTNAGAAYVFVRNGATWTQQAYVKASNTGTTDELGSAVALSGDTLAVAAHTEASRATGINGNQADNAAASAGAVYMFVRTGAIWAQHAYVKASNTESFDVFGAAVALSSDTLAIGAPGESSGATGVNPTNGQGDNAASRSGAIYLFR
jgi:hypothetical protein